MPRPKIIAANWKMNPPPSNLSAYHGTDNVHVFVFPAAIDLVFCKQHNLVFGGQCARAEDAGAFTGDISMRMLAASGASAVLCGHSERRQHHGETDVMVAAQAKAALTHHLTPFVCIGETLAQREAGEEKAIIKEQMKLLPHGSPGIVIAYEPVWAIGTGKTATPQQAQEMHAYIRSRLPEDMRAKTMILYGGSMNASNAKDLLSMPDIDGGLVGGASLKPDEFKIIVESAAR